MKKIFLVTFFVAILAAYYYFSSIDAEKLRTHHAYVIKEGQTLLAFDLLDPQEAPQANVMRGYRLMLNTHYYVPEYAKDQLSCTNCHFMGGDTLGGKNNGISLVGVTAIYPKYSERHKRIISIEERINDCFENSMNGNPLPKESEQMQDIVAYFE